MKRIFALCLALLMFIAIPCEAFAVAPEMSEVSEEVLIDFINKARNELARRGLVAAENTVLVDQDGVQVYMTGNNKVEVYDDSAYLYMEVVIINDSDKDIAVVEEDASVNGWEVTFFGIGGVSAGKKKKDSFEFVISDADISSLEEIEDIEMNLKIIDENAYETVSAADGVRVYFNT